MDHQSLPHDDEKKEDLIDNRQQKSETSGSDDNNGQSKEWKCKCQKSYSRQSSLHNHIRIKHDNLKDQFEIRNNVRPGRPKNAEGKEKPGGTKNEKQLLQPKCVSDYDWAIMSIFADQALPELLTVVKSELSEHYNQEAQVQLPPECKRLFDELVEVAEVNDQELNALTTIAKPFGLVANMIKVEKREMFFGNFTIAAILSSCEFSNKPQIIKSLREHPLFNQKIFQDFSEILRKYKKNASNGGSSQIIEKQETSQSDKPLKEPSNKQSSLLPKEKVASAPLIRNLEPNDRQSHNHSYDHLNRFYSDFQSHPQQNSAYPQNQKKQQFHSTHDICYQTSNSNYPQNPDNHGIPVPLFPLDQQSNQNHQHNRYQPQSQQYPSSYEHQQYQQSKQYQYQQQQQQQQFYQPQQHPQQQQFYQYQYYQQPSQPQNANQNQYQQIQQNSHYQQNNFLHNQSLPQQPKIQPYPTPDPYLQPSIHQPPPAYSHQQLAQVQKVAARNNVSLGKNIPNENVNDKLNHPFPDSGYGTWIPPQQRDEYSEQYQENPIQSMMTYETPNYQVVHDPATYFNAPAVDDIPHMRYEQNEFLNQNQSRSRNLNQNNNFDNHFFERQVVKQQEQQEQEQSQLDSNVPLNNPPAEFQQFPQSIENHLIGSRDDCINNNDIPQIQQFQQPQSGEEEEEEEEQRQEQGEGEDEEDEEEADEISDSFGERLNNK